jgi:2,3-bisphosphoglycerate-independent phosphoglycerate mutase
MAPEMSAGQITDKLIDYVNQNQPDFICLNYANTDMVGHTGDFEAAIAATEFVDVCLGKITNELFDKGYYTVIIADHGNSDVMRNPDGSPNTAHTTNPVPVLLAGPDVTTENYTVLNGKLGDIAPSILAVMGINPPSEMTGNCIFVRK